LTGLALLVIVITIALPSCTVRSERPENGISTSPDLQTVSWHEFGRTISVSYEKHLAASAGAATVPAVLVSDQILFAEAHPAYVQIRFLGFPRDGVYQLPVIEPENNVPQVIIFQTSDFAGYGDDSPQGFVQQLGSLTEVLKSGVDPKRCALPLQGYDTALPFLPWINMRQSFCAQPQILEFDGGKGIRYLSYYAQDPSPVLDGSIFYTFQGLTDDGQFYISALFPIQTGIFPKEPSLCEECSDPNYNPLPAWTTLVTTQLAQLNVQDANAFTPSLTTLDEVIQSIHIEP
jgi:hypothetical protein